MENVKDIAFNQDGTVTITLNDGTVTTYVNQATVTAPTSVTLQPGQSFTVTAAAPAQQGNAAA